MANQTRSKRWTWKGIPTSRLDAMRCDKALSLWTTLVTDILPREANRLYACLGRYAQMDIYYFVSDLSSARSALLECDRGGSLDELRRSFNRTVASLQYGNIIRIVWKAVADTVWDDPEVFRGALTIFSFLSRLNLQDIPVQDILERDYVDFERNHIFSLPDSRAELREIWTEWLEGFQLDFYDFRPKHGPGAIAESRRISQTSKFGSFCDYTRRSLARCRKYPWWPSTVKTVEGSPTCVIEFVPKSYKTYRTISKEPCLLMYYQQGIWHQLRRYIEHNRKIPISFSNTDISRNLALEGSYFGDFATIDCSNASDSVGAEQIGYLLSNLPAIQEAVFAGRSTHVLLPSGRHLKLRKFAPMGSALCFPIESLFFASICELACRRRGRRYRYQVYGDDIVADSRIAVDIIHLLQQYGVAVNEEKTFTTRSVLSAYREACGIECYRGIDVTPLRIPRFWDATRYVSRHCNLEDLSEAINSNIDFINNAFIARYKGLRAQLMSDLEAVIPLCDVPFSFPPEEWTPAIYDNTVIADGRVYPSEWEPHQLRLGSRSVWTFSPTNWRGRMRWNEDLHRNEMLVFAPTFRTAPYEPVHREIPQDLAAYEQWMSRPHDRLHQLVDERCREERQVDRRVTGIALEWITIE